ncbi:MAG TPA: Cys-Cys-COOH (seleno)protein SaoC [Tissierellales bacterium]|nr:Cys-Cys-COOH (seleno)protein SaoC [Tissierellales bacterium]
MKWKKARLAILIIVIVGLGGWAFNQDKIRQEEDLGVSLGNELLLHFKSEYPDKEVLKCGYEDVNDDGIKDLVVIFNNNKKSNGMVVVLDNGEYYSITEEVPAPIENQTIEFKNIDEIGPIEFIVSGSKNGRFGYAIFRVEDLKIKDLFGEGMEDCC